MGRAFLILFTMINVSANVEVGNMILVYGLELANDFLTWIFQYLHPNHFMHLTLRFQRP